MTNEATGEFAMFAPETDDAVEYEFHAHELKTWMGRFHLSVVHHAGREEGYDPYNNTPPKKPVQQ